MDVFLVPVGTDKSALYCEVPLDAPAGAQSGSRWSWWRRPLERFRHTLVEAEVEQRRSETGQAAPRKGLWRAVMRKLAEVIAEQRLLWQLRKHSTCRLVHADDVPAGRALETARAALRRDFEKHRRWIVVDMVLLIISVPLTLIPGPNLAALYFSFRVVGHYMSLRGATQGLSGIRWDSRPAPELTALRAALGLDRAARAARLDEIAKSLGLDDLAPFVERIAVRPS